MGRSCLLNGEDRPLHSYLLFIVKRQEVRHIRLKELGLWILNTASYLFEGVILGSEPEKAGFWSHPGIAGLSVPV